MKITKKLVLSGEIYYYKLGICMFGDNENYRYLQFLDILENKDNIPIEVANENKILYDIIEECHLDFEKLIKYAKETNNKKSIR